MKNWIYAGMIIPFMSLQAENKELIREEQLAQAFFAAHAYDSSRLFYENVLNTSPPAWQQALVLYNLGLIQLAQNQLNEALAFFRSIPFNSISNPLLLQNIFMSQGLVYALKAKTRFEQDSFDADLQRYFLEESQLYLNKAKQVSCQTQLLEHSTLSDCLLPIDLSQLLQINDFYLRQIRQQQRKALLNPSSFWGAFSLTKKGLTRLKFFLESLPPHPDHSYFSYLFESSLDLVPLWEEINKEEKYQPEMQKASNLYLSALTDIEEKKWNESLKKIEQIEEIFDHLEEDLDEKEAAQLQWQEIRLDYELLMTHNTLSLQTLKQLVEKQKKLPEDSNIKSSNRYLELSIKALESGQDKQAQSFLLAGFFSLQNHFSEKSHLNDPESILRQAIREGKKALQLNQLHQIEAQTSPPLEEMSLMILSHQKEATQVAQSFTESALNQQQKRFRQLESNPMHVRCQQAPWEQVIPAFEQGYKHALAAQKSLSHPAKRNQALNEQEQMLLAWQKALALLTAPVTESQASHGQMNQMPADTRDLFQSLQNMEINDITPKPKSQKEILGW